MTEPAIRRLRADEWRLLRDVRLRALLDAPMAFLRTHAEESARDDEHWQERAAGSATSSTSAVYVAIHGSDAVGMAGGWQRDPDRVVVWGVWVDPSRRGAGIGEALIGAVERWALEETNASDLSLEVAEGNERAGEFYQRLGFEPSGVRTPFREGTGLMETEFVKSLAVVRRSGG